MGADHYTIVSADCHAGADLPAYRDYLPSRWHDDFDTWADAFENVFGDLDHASAVRNWDSSRRRADLESDGIIAEVIFPNTVPPFFPSDQLVAAPPRSAAELEQRTAGLHAHNRWLAEFCAETPGRRAGLAQVFTNDIDAAVAEVAWAAENGLRGVLVPAIPPDAGLPALWSETHDPLWAACQDYDLTVTQHGGAGLPDLEGASARNFLMLMEVPFFANRGLWHMILGGAFERFPGLRFVMTEQRVGWVPEVLAKMDRFWHLMTTSGSIGEMPSDEQMLPQPPSSYFHRNCWMGSSFTTPREAEAIRIIGADRVMWGSDYPHSEGTFPHSSEALRHSFHDWDPTVLHELLGRTAAEVYGLDFDSLTGHGIGPRVDVVAEPLDTIPDSRSLAFLIA